ncbi:hypothetical protein GCM10011533_35690 [Streptosporangium jomthongense]|nr:hypothetical protein GCM10011533_35690 [Streptosporangium jomthongense]
MSQAFARSGYIQTIVNDEVRTFVQRYREVPELPVDLALRARFNPQLNKSWFGAVMQVTPFEIMSSKVCAMALVVLAATAFALTAVVQGWRSVPIQGSLSLFLVGAALHLFATTSMGIFLGTVARSMPQFTLLLMLVLLPLQMFSGGSTPRESMPDAVQYIMLATPNTHFVMLAQAILYRGAGLTTVWPQFLAIAVIGATLFGFTLTRFRRTLSTMG